LCDGTAANDYITVIQHYSLAGRYCPLRLVEYDSAEAVCFRIYSGGLLRHAGTSLGFYLHRLL
jgi:hypothetical protein